MDTIPVRLVQVRARTGSKTLTVGKSPGVDTIPVRLVVVQVSACTGSKTLMVGKSPGVDTIPVRLIQAGDVTVSTSAFRACLQCCCAGLSLAPGLESSGFSMWHFLKLVARGFL